MSEFVLKNGMKLYYETFGEGKPVVLMHGWTSTHEVYEEPVKILSDSKKAKFIIYDHRGHGGSKSANGGNPTLETLADDLSELINGLSLSDVTLVGWSMGAGVAMNYVRKYGCEALSQIVLCDMTPKQLNDETWKLGLYKGNYSKTDMERDKSKPFIKLYQAFAVGAMPRLAKIPGFLLRPILKKRLKNCDESVLRSFSASMKSQDNRDVIGKITVPFTYFYAVPGSLFSPDLEKWYKKSVSEKIPFRSVAFPESTHMFISEHPEKFAEELGKII